MVRIKQGTKIEEIKKVKTPEVKLPAFEPRVTKAPKIETNQPQIRRNADTGKIVGVKFPDGRDITASAKEVRGLVANYTKKRQAPLGSVEASAITKKQAALDETTALVEQLGDVPDITEERRAELEAEVSPGAQFAEGLPGALREGTTQAVTRGLTLGAAGAAAGALGGPAAPVTVPVAAAIGAAAGVISGYWTAIRGATKSEAKEDVSNAMAEFTQLKKGMTNIATLATSSQINPEEAVELYNAQYSRMLELQAQLKYLTDSDLKDYLSDGSGNLITVSTFLDEVAPVYKTRLQTAFLNPSETTIPYSDEFEGEE